MVFKHAGASSCGGGDAGTGREGDRSEATGSAPPSAAVPTEPASGSRLFVRLRRVTESLTKRFALGVAYGAGTGVGGFAIGCAIVWAQSR